MRLADNIESLILMELHSINMQLHLLCQISINDTSNPKLRVAYQQALNFASSSITETLKQFREEKRDD